MTRESNNNTRLRLPARLSAEHLFKAAKLTSVCAIALVGTAYPLGHRAFAQDSAASEAQTLEEIHVTGSRIKRSGFNSPNPITVIDREQIDRLGLVNVGDVVGQLPMNNPQTSPTNTSQGSLNGYVSDANVGAQLANLRGLNPFLGTRTLTLVDGHRFVPSTNSGDVDLSLIPSNLVERTEVVTGGASAAYGSDAVSGVVNIVLDHNLEGIRGQVDYGETFRSDGGDFHAGLAGGAKLFGGKGHIVAGFEYQDSQPVGPCLSTRSWCKSYAIFDTPPNVDNAGLPDYVLVDNARGALTETGVIIATTQPGVVRGVQRGFQVPTDYPFSDIPDSLRGKQFNSDGTRLVNWDVGDFIDPAGRLMSGGDGMDPDFGTLSRTAFKRTIGYTRFQYDFSDRLQGFVEASYGKREAQNSGYGLQNSITGTVGTAIKWDNAYLPAGMSDLFDLNGDGAISAADGETYNGFFINKANTDFPEPLSTAKNETYRIVTGLEGEFGNGWTWDTYYTYGRNDQAQRYLNARRNARAADEGTGITLRPGPIGPQYANQTQYTVSPWDWAVDAVVDPSTGDIACRVNVDDPTINPNYAAIMANPDIAPIAQACAPLNILGTGNGTQAAYDYVFGTEVEDYRYTQHVVGANLQGDILEGWAGPLAMATGFEYRLDKGATTHDGYPPEYWWPDYGSDFNGKQEVLEGYVEADMTVLKDMPAVRSLNLNAAIRQTHNKAEGKGVTKTFNITTWKASAVWDTSDWLRFRATRSHDVRAPSFRELFFPGRDTNFFTANPWQGGVTDTILIIGNGGGNVDLTPENADTWTLGTVIQPGGALDGLRFSADFYQIKLENGIANVYTNGVTSACFASGGTDILCDRITGVGDAVSGYTDIDTITTGSLNANSFTTRGIDFETDYVFQLDRVNADWGGKLNFHILVSYLKDLVVTKENRGTLFGAQQLSTFSGTNYAGQVGAGGVDDIASFSESPHWQGNATANYSNGPFSTTMQARYVGSAKYYSDLTGTDDPAYDPDADNSFNVDNHVGSYWLFNWSASYHFDNGIEMFGTVNNVFDRAPRFAPPITGVGGVSGGGSSVTNPVYYDTIGRRFRVGLRFTY